MKNLENTNIDIKTNLEAISIIDLNEEAIEVMKKAQYEFSRNNFEIAFSDRVTEETLEWAAKAIAEEGVKSVFFLQENGSLIECVKKYSGKEIIATLALEEFQNSGFINGTVAVLDTSMLTGGFDVELPKLDLEGLIDVLKEGDVKKVESFIHQFQLTCTEVVQEKINEMSEAA